MFDPSGIESFGDFLKQKTSRKSAEDRLNETEELLSNPEEWIGNPETARQLETMTYPKIGTKLHPSLIEEQINLQSHEADSIEELALNTYSKIIKEDPNTAEEFRKATHVNFNGEEAIKNRIDNLLANYDDLGIEEEQAVKEALTLVNQTEYELDGSELNGDYVVDVVANRSLEQQLSDEVFSRLDEEAQVFFDYARREDAPEGVHSNFSIDAKPADNYSPKEVLQKRAEDLKQEYGENEFDLMDSLRNRDNIYETSGIENLLLRADMGHRFDMEEKEDFEHEAQAYLSKWMERMSSRKEDAEFAIGLLSEGVSRAGDYTGLDQEELEQRGISGKIDDIREDISYLQKQREKIGYERKGAREMRNLNEMEDSRLLP